MGVVPELVDEILGELPAELCEEIYRALRYDWRSWARPEQVVPEGEWDILGLVAGRGGGKTRPGAEWARELAETHPGAHMALVGRTAADVRDTMVEGESGILACSPPWFRPRYFPQLRVVLWPNKFRAHLYSADQPDLLRGPQHHFAWGDELAAWRRREALSNLLDGLRLGDCPRALFTTTPRRVPLFLDMFLGPKDAMGGRSVPLETARRPEWDFTLRTKDHTGAEVTVKTIVRRWATERNAGNLAPGFAAKRRAAYGDSSYGRMEMDGEIQEVVEGALFQLAIIDVFRVTSTPQTPRRVVSVDPSMDAAGRHDACGIIVCGSGAAPDGKASDPHGYVLADRSLHASPRDWGRVVVAAYDEFRCDLIVYESNTPPGKPDVVRDVIRSVDPKHRIRWEAIYASRDKRIRADPVAALYEAGRVHHVEDAERPNQLSLLEEEMASWDPWDPKAPSPNRLDALVHGISYLLLGAPSRSVAPVSLGTRPSPWRV